MHDAFDGAGDESKLGYEAPRILRAEKLGGKLQSRGSGIVKPWGNL